MTTDIDEIERLLAAATPGDQWFVVRYGDGDSLVICRDEAGNQRIAFMAVPGCRDHLARNRAWKEIKANAALIVTLHNSAPAMIAELRELRAENARLKSVRHTCCDCDQVFDAAPSQGAFICNSCAGAD